MENQTFNISFQFEVGELNNLLLPIASKYVDYLGTSKYSAEQIKEEFYNLACNFYFSSDDKYTYLNISGLSENFEKALELSIHLLQDMKADEEALQNMIADQIQSRNDAKSNQGAITYAMLSYGIYDPELVKYQLSFDQLKALTSAQLIETIKETFNYMPEIYYYGPEKMDQLKKKIEVTYLFPKRYKKPEKAKEFKLLNIKENDVLFVQYDAKQSRLYTYSYGTPFNVKELPIITMYNQYFGGSMNAIVFQEMREKRSLAYTAQSRYVPANELNKDNYNFSYIATQNDKVIDAFTAFDELFNDMPQSQPAFDLAKEGAMSSIETNRITKNAIFSMFRTARKMGIKEDYRKAIYEQLKNFTLQDIVQFNEQYIKNKPKRYMIVADEKDLDFNAIEKQFGPVKKVKLEDIFGY